MLIEEIVRNDARTLFTSENAGLIAALILYVLICCVCYLRVIQATGGPYVYPLDETYIHTSVAKHMAQNGAFGLTPYVYSSSI